MTIPTTGNITSAMVQTEWSFSLPFTSAQVATAAGLTTPWTSNDLRGKSARTISITILGYRQVRMGGAFGNNYYDEITFGIRVDGSGTPSSYFWSGNVSGNGSTVIFRGPTYNTDAWYYQETGWAYCDTVIEGQPYSAHISFTYSQGDLV